MKPSMILTLVFTAVLAFSACTVNVNQPNVNTIPVTNIASPLPTTTVPAISKARWSVVVCSSRAKNITLSAGASETDSEVFTTWREGTPQRVFDFPPKVQNLSSVYLKASSSDNNQVELCILFDGQPKKRVEFEEDEDTTVNATDTDNLDKCRCTK
jgi:hypothetical protein